MRTACLPALPLVALIATGLACGPAEAPSSSSADIQADTQAAATTDPGLEDSAVETASTESKPAAQTSSPTASIARNASSTAVPSGFQNGFGSTTLAVGDPAPQLEHVAWLQGGPFPQWEAGHVYLLDFWATWCNPCLRFIPELDRTAERYAADNVHVIGLAVDPRPGQFPTADFVRLKGDEMSYPVGTDVAGRTNRDFMFAARQQSLPTLMIVDGTGTLAWIGHPEMDPEGAIEKILAGNFDAAQHDAEYLENRSRMATEYEPLAMAFQQAWGTQDWTEAAAKAELIAELSPLHFGKFGIYRYLALINLEDDAAAATWGRYLVDDLLQDDAAMLDSIAWQIVSPSSTLSMERRDLDLALAASKRARDLTLDMEPSVLDTLARVHFLRGDTQQAVDTMKKAVQRVPSRARDQFQQRLQEYEDALEPAS